MLDLKPLRHNKLRLRVRPAELLALALRPEADRGWVGAGRGGDGDLAGDLELAVEEAGRVAGEVMEGVRGELEAVEGRDDCE